MPGSSGPTGLTSTVRLGRANGRMANSFPPLVSRVQGGKPLQCSVCLGQIGHERTQGRNEPAPHAADVHYLGYDPKTAAGCSATAIFRGPARICSSARNRTMTELTPLLVRKCLCMISLNFSAKKVGTPGNTNILPRLSRGYVWPSVATVAPSGTLHIFSCASLSSGPVAATSLRPLCAEPFTAKSSRIRRISLLTTSGRPTVPAIASIVMSSWVGPTPPLVITRSH
eukprot:scaffold4219_cov618-Prasinococcus_capsulatus_cf.AAC.4